MEDKSKPICLNMEEKSKPVKVVEPSQDIPIFLRKTYHMIDSCDPSIACWSEDGETFVVKDPVKFERTIIPQFFKHSKFSSFVRQLNFYAFRKIKYADTLRIDPKLEAETANYWRFRHDKFQKGKPELLSEIKRMNGQKATKSNANNVSDKTKQDPDALKSELNTLKKKIEDMTKNMDELTSLVKEVSLKQESPSEMVGAKRKKVDSELPDPYAEIRPDELISSMDFDEDLNAKIMASPEVVPCMETMPSPELPVNPEGDAASMSDNDFVDQLFTVFSDDDDDEIQIEPEGVVSASVPSLPSLPMPTLAPSPSSTPTTPTTSVSPSTTSTSTPKPGVGQNNRPDPELMERLSEALSILPRSMQERIVDRLVAAIMSTDSVEKTIGAASTLNSVDIEADVVPGGKALPSNIAPSPVRDEDQDKPSSDVSVGMPLASATLSALLSHYSSQVKAQNVQKTIPVIPVHA